jgi:sulfite exporter TauE/SafE
MDQATAILVGTAAGIGFFHTLVGVDHSLPFVMLARAQQWSLRKLLGVTAVCGVGHILSSVLIGCIGVALGVALGELEALQTRRGSLAAWLLIAFGLTYMVWGIWRSIKNRRHAHPHGHGDGTVHLHEHDHQRDHCHVHATDKTKTLTLLGLFIVFVLGPCEALIPMVIAPAFERSWVTVALVVGVFGGTTLLTMLVLVTIGYSVVGWGERSGVLRGLERHLHALAGFAIAASGAAIQLLGL